MKPDGKTIGLNINLPFEQVPNAYITPDLNFEFHYFFMRKLWFAYLAKALVVFPGGFGTFDEMFELLTLSQTEKLAKHICVVVYGREYWDGSSISRHWWMPGQFGKRPRSDPLGEQPGRGIPVSSGRSGASPHRTLQSVEKEPEIAKTRR